MSATVFVAESEHELRALRRFRYQWYVDRLHLRPAGADHVARELADDLDSHSVQYGLVENGDLRGSLRIAFLELLPAALAERQIRRFQLASLLADERIKRSDICFTSRFIAESEGAGLSRGILHLMTLGFEDAIRRTSVRFNFGDCSPSLLGFYRHMGFRPFGAPIRDPDYGYKLLLAMLLRDVSLFRDVRSPLARVSARYPPDRQARQVFDNTYGLSESSQCHSGGVLNRLLRSCDGKRWLATGLLNQDVVRCASVFRAHTGDVLVESAFDTDALFLCEPAAVSIESEGLEQLNSSWCIVGSIIGQSHPRPHKVIALRDFDVLVFPLAGLAQAAHQAADRSLADFLSWLAAARLNWVEAIGIPSPE